MKPCRRVAAAFVVAASVLGAAGACGNAPASCDALKESFFGVRANKDNYREGSKPEQEIQADLDNLEGEFNALDCDGDIRDRFKPVGPSI